MGEIRGEKVTFRKEDIVPLHQLPSAQIADPLIVHCPPPGSTIRRLMTVILALVVLVMASVGGLIGAIESGMLDKALSNRAQTALNDAIGPRYHAEVGSTVLRFTAGLSLALEARDVTTVEQSTGKHLSRTASIRLVLDPFALVDGRIAVTTIEADGVQLDTAVLPSRDPFDFSTLRVDMIPAALEKAYLQLDALQAFVDKGQTSKVLLSGLDLRFMLKSGKPLTVFVQDLLFERDSTGALRLTGDVAIDGAVSRLNVTAQVKDHRAVSLSASLDDVALTPFMLKYNQQGEPRQGLDGATDISINSQRADPDGKPTIALGLTTRGATFYSEAIAQEIGQAKINAVYDFDKNSLEFVQSLAQFGGTSVPFTGAVIDLDRLDAQAGAGFGIDLLVSAGTATAAGSGEAPVQFDAKVTGRFITPLKELRLEQMAVQTPVGGMVGSLLAKFGEGSPQISFGSQAKTVQTAAVKQLWPFWMAPKARSWVLKNLFGGTVTNASIAVFIPAGRIPPEGGPLRLDENELQISFDIDNARLNVAGDIPPIRDTEAHFDLKGPRIAVTIKDGASYFPSGRSVTLKGGDFVIPASYDKPLMAEMNIDVAGAADAVAELVTYRPVKVLQRTGFEPADFTGNITASVQARFGLVTDQKPPPPEWKTAMVLSNVDVAKPIAGRAITGLDGTLDIDPKKALLAAKGNVDSVPMEINLTEPVDPDAGVERQRLIKATLDNSQRNKLVPGLNDIIDGPAKVEFSLVGEDRQAVTVDLRAATISVPWIGWTKGSGIAAKAAFEIVGKGKDVTISDFEVFGEGFGASGDMVFSKGGLSSADFSKVRLAAGDNYALKLKRTKGGYDISVSGKSADVRPVIAKLRSAQSGGGQTDATSMSTTVRASLDKIIGFNDESVSNVSLVYAMRGGQTSSIEFSGVTGSGQAAVVQMATNNGDKIIQITSGDAGAVARFADFYERISGGLLNVKLRAGQNQTWSGNVDIRSFALADEQRLQTIVSTPVGDDGRSLNTAVKRDIDVSSERFQRGFARLSFVNNELQVENGVLRGEQVGATFQGTLRDRNGNMNMTGTFMPAYGLNRLFAELPVIGAILGNGRDRGLLGITFQLKGKLESPKLAINPLSLIAPGIFRQIFEF